MTSVVFSRFYPHVCINCVILGGLFFRVRVLRPIPLNMGAFLLTGAAVDIKIWIALH